MHIAIHWKTLADALVDTLADIVVVTEERTLRYSPRDVDVKALVDTLAFTIAEKEAGTYRCKSLVDVQAEALILTMGDTLEKAKV